MKVGAPTVLALAGVTGLVASRKSQSPSVGSKDV